MAKNKVAPFFPDTVYIHYNDNCDDAVLLPVAAAITAAYYYHYCYKFLTYQHISTLTHTFTH